MSWPSTTKTPCPYGSYYIDGSFLPMFRLHEHLDDGTSITKDSFGDHAWISRPIERQCHISCPCHQLLSPELTVAIPFVATLEKATSLKIKVYSPQLRSDINLAVPQAEADHWKHDDEIDGQILLINRPSLLSLLASLSVPSQLSTPTTESQGRISELELLTEGLLNDEHVTNVMDSGLHRSDHGFVFNTPLRTLISNQDVINTLRRIGAGLSDNDESQGQDQDGSKSSVSLESPSSSFDWLDDWHGEKRNAIDSYILDDDEAFDNKVFDTESILNDLLEDFTPTHVSPDIDSRETESLRASRPDRLSRSVRDCNVPNVQEILQEWSEDMYQHGAAGHNEAMKEMCNRMLLESLNHEASHIARILLDRHADVETITDGLNALSIASNRRSEQLIKLLLGYGADPACAVILLRNVSDAQSIGFLTRAVRAYRSETRKHLGHVGKRMQRVRKLFFEDHSTFVDFAKQDTGRGISFVPMLSSTGRLISECFYGPPLPELWNPYFVDMGAQRAWAESLTILQGLCSGRAPRSAKDILLFSLLAKAMSHVLDNTTQLSSEVVKDLGRWQVLLEEDIRERQALRRAVKTVWKVDIRGPYSWFSANQISLSEALQHFRLAAEDMVTRTRHFFASEQRDVFGTPSFRSDWPEPTDTGPYNLPESLDEATDHVQTTRKVRSGPSSTSEDGRSRGEPRLCIKSESTAPELIIALAGIIFAVVLAFLISKLTKPKNIGTWEAHKTQ
ncbi:hypothetical protein BJ166DRAFT_517507 [Pestalotiopsis sp. NC0098]|nr:hypothetical protein BJ166DRAFT_517507 [Pestalotiopsis sp. NC0098]